MADQTSENTSENEEPFIIRVIQYLYSTTPPIKSPAQICQESWLIAGLIPFNRWFCMPAAFIVQFCCGSLYSWSVLNKPIDNWIYGSVVNMAPRTFYIAVGLLGMSAANMGPWLERNGPRKASILGGSFFFVGNLITALALYWRQIWLVYLGYGVIAGCGIGICYISPVSALQKWFPDRRGLASGIAVSGFGAGSIVSAKLEVFLIEMVDLPGTFLVLGAGYFLLIVLSGLVLRTPPPGFVPGPANMNSVEITLTRPTPIKSDDPNNQQDIEEQDWESSDSVEYEEECTILEALISVEFRMMYFVFFCNILFGLVVISRLSNMITDIFGKSAESASTVVAINGGFNLAGRIFFPLLSDCLGRKNVYLLMLTFQLIILTTFYFVTTTKTYWLFLMSMWIISACYGGGFGTIPAFLSDKYGQHIVGATHGVILSAWSLAGILGGIVFTSVFKEASKGKDESDPFAYNVNAWWMLAFVILGWLFLTLITPTEKDRKIYRLFGRDPVIVVEKSKNRSGVTSSVRVVMRHKKQRVVKPEVYLSVK